jgi:trigger factor
VAELVDALDLGSSGVTRESSSLSSRTILDLKFPVACHGDNKAMGDYQGGEAQALPLGQACGFIPRAKSKQFTLGNSMQVTVENLSSLERKLNITLPAEKVTETVQAKLKEITPKAKLPGFRPGKIPAAVIEKRFGPSARADAIETLIRESFGEAIKEQNLNPVSFPKFDITNDKPNEPFGYTAQFEVYPEIKLSDFSKMEVEKLISEVTDADVNEMVEKLRNEHITWKDIKDPKRKSQHGDQLTVDFTVLVYSTDRPPEPTTEKNVKFVLGGGFMWPEFEKPLYGVSAGEEKKYTLKFPLTHVDKKLVGKTADFEVKINKLCEPILPELNDEFAKKLKIEAGTFDGLKAEVRKNMERELQHVLKNLFKSSITEKLVDQHPIDIPKMLALREAEQLKQRWEQRFGGLQKSGQMQAPPEERIVQQATRNVALGLLLAAVIKEAVIKVNPEELRAKVKDMASVYEDAEKIENWYYSNRDHLLEVESMLLEEKALDYLSSKIKAVDKPVSYKNAMERK